MVEMIKQSSDMLLKACNKVIRPGQKYAFAIDKTQDPYYGKHDDKPDTYTGGGKRKASTNHFFTYFTMSIVDQGHHITLFSVPWQNDMKNVVSIQQCVELIDSLGLKIRSLCLDREFFNAAILRYLQQSGIPHIVPAKKSGRSLKAMLKGRASSTFSYTMNKGTKDSVDLVITDCVVYMMGKHKKKGLEHHAFAVFGLSTSPRNVREIYRHRFAIESTYRLRNSVRPKTSTKDEKIRYFYTLLSFIIQNMWVSEKWIRCAKQKPGPKVIEENRVSLKFFSDIIVENSSLLFRHKRMDEITIT
jgi:putative transposase